MSIVPETVGKGDIGINLNALGTVTSLATVTIRTQISGYLIKVDFKEGDEVKKGDLIAEIDSRPYEAALAQQRASSRATGAAEGRAGRSYALPGPCRAERRAAPARSTRRQPWSRNIRARSKPIAPW